MTQDIIEEVLDYDASQEENETPKNEEGTEDPETSESEKTETEQSDFKKSKEFQSLMAQKEHYKRKYESLKKFENPSQKFDQEEWQNKVNFLLTHRDFNEEEFDHIATVAKRHNITLSEAAKKEEDYINFRRQKIKELNKIPSSSKAKSQSFKKSPEEIAKMSSAELREYERLLDSAEAGGEI